MTIVLFSIKIHHRWMLGPWVKWNPFSIECDDSLSLLNVLVLLLFLSRFLLKRDKLIKETILIFYNSFYNRSHNSKWIFICYLPTLWICAKGQFNFFFFYYWQGIINLIFNNRHIKNVNGVSWVQSVWLTMIWMANCN